MRTWLLAAAVAAVSYAGFAGAQGMDVAQPAPPEAAYDQGKGIWKGIEITAGGGVEGFFGKANDWVNPGPTWGVTLSGRPTRGLGLELNYSGAAIEMNEDRFGGVDPISGADIVRNGGSAVATFGPVPRGGGVQPYALAGIGFSHFNIRDSALRSGVATNPQVLGFRSNTGGAVPLGVGLRTHMGGGFAADLRFNYNLGFNEDFLPTSSSNANRYQATLQIGGHF